MDIEYIEWIFKYPGNCHANNDVYVETLCLSRYLSPLSVIDDSLTLARLTYIVVIIKIVIVIIIIKIIKIVIIIIIIIINIEIVITISYISDETEIVAHPGEASQSLHKGIPSVDSLKS